LHIRCNYCIKAYQLEEGFVAFGVHKKFEALLLAHLTHEKSLKTNKKGESYGLPK
jgi:hypothetical protein